MSITLVSLGQVYWLNNLKEINPYDKEKISFILRKYFIKQYEALKNLNTYNYNEFFSRSIEAVNSCNINSTLINTIIRYRRDFANETYLKNYNFKLKIFKVKKYKENYYIKLKEEFRYKYTFLNVDTSGSNEHEFKLVKIKNDFKIYIHKNKDKFLLELNDILEKYLNEKYEVEEIEENLLYRARINRNYVNNYIRRGSIKNLQKLKIINKLRYRDKFINYNRINAVNYAIKWANGRNPAYLDFDKLGGDCTNFVSQCIYAGGIPMDIEKPYIWKYYKSYHDQTSNKCGRSASWTSVKAFREYVKGNITGMGLRAELNADIWTLLPGDIIQIEDYHGTVIVKNIYRNGKLVDFLIACHSDDRLNESLFLEWPSLSYNKMGIKIKGAFS